jgi:sigma-B regulation protein RsbU (phosphoserine phosphatase)
MQGSLAEVKLELVTSKGDRVPVVMNAVRTPVGGGFVVDVALFVARDRDAYERELLLARERLEAAAVETASLHAEANDRALFAEQMVGIVSHDLRNPLSAIQMGAHLLLADARVPDDQRKILDRIIRATGRAASLISNLLDFTQARIGKGLTIVPKPIDLQRVVREAVEELVLGHPAAVLVHEPIGEGECIADAARLEQVVGNLASNASAYGTPGRPIKVRSVIEEATVTVSVENEGTPIPPDLQTNMFEPMVRGREGATRIKSIGLGLFIVQQIARAHGGEPFVKSTDSTNVVGVTIPRR